MSSRPPYPFRTCLAILLLGPVLASAEMLQLEKPRSVQPARNSLSMPSPVP
ncbi:hypothetical protein [Pseudomonas sp. OHS18]|uniref:hypothetical protein n=1 Tax=Pseudomonas sp. OHS18 TaxID=3399679 RepID=UPI003A894107